MILLDTHAAVWLATDDGQLGKRSRALIDAASKGSTLAISAISFWEIALASTELTLHGDPADRFIAASAISLAATLVTADDKLLAWKNSLKRQDARR